MMWENLYHITSPDESLLDLWQQLYLDSPKVKGMKRMLTFIQPLLQHLHRDQCRELALENDLLGMI